MDDQIELKPCPFCGFEKPFLTNCEYRKSMWTIRCPNCKIETTVPVVRQKWGNVYCGNEESNRKRLIESWNRRTELNAANRWISVDKRLPETNEPVLVWYEYFRYGRYNRMYQTYGIARYFSEVRKWLIEGCNTSTDKVLYWCPLPPPMKIEEPPDDKEEEEVLDE